MGVVNVTPDSFSDGGRWFTPGAAVRARPGAARPGRGPAGRRRRVDAARRPPGRGRRRAGPGAAGDRASWSRAARPSASTPRARSSPGRPSSAGAVDRQRRLGRAGRRRDVRRSWPRRARSTSRCTGAGTPTSWTTSTTTTTWSTDVRRELAARVAALRAAGRARRAGGARPGPGLRQGGRQQLAAARAAAGAGRRTASRCWSARAASGSSGTCWRGPDGEPAPPLARDRATAAVSALAAAAGAWCVRVHEVAGSADAVRVAAAWQACAGARDGAEGRPRTSWPWTRTREPEGARGDHERREPAGRAGRQRAPARPDQADGHHGDRLPRRVRARAPRGADVRRGRRRAPRHPAGRRRATTSRTPCTTASWRSRSPRCSSGEPVDLIETVAERIAATVLASGDRAGGRRGRAQAERADRGAVRRRRRRHPPRPLQAARRRAVPAAPGRGGRAGRSARCRRATASFPVTPAPGAPVVAAAAGPSRRRPRPGAAVGRRRPDARRPSSSPCPPARAASSSARSSPDALDQVARRCPSRSVLALGANLGPAQETLRAGGRPTSPDPGIEVARRLAARPDHRGRRARSSPDYLNAVVLARTTLVAARAAARHAGDRARARPGAAGALGAAHAGHRHRAVRLGARRDGRPRAPAPAGPRARVRPAAVGAGRTRTRCCPGWAADRSARWPRPRPTVRASAGSRSTGSTARDPGGRRRRRARSRPGRARRPRTRDAPHPLADAAAGRRRRRGCGHAGSCCAPSRAAAALLPTVPWLVVVGRAASSRRSCSPWAGPCGSSCTASGRNLDPIRAARTAVLAKASCYTGALLAGWYGGQVLALVTRPRRAGQRRRARSRPASRRPVPWCSRSSASSSSGSAGSLRPRRVPDGGAASDPQPDPQRPADAGGRMGA